MRKLLLGTTILMLSTSVLATDDKDRTGFYLKMNVGANKINDIKEKSQDINLSVKSKSEISPMFAIGVGGYINNVMRVDLTFDYLKVDFKNTKNTIKIEVEDKRVKAHISLDRKAYIYSGMLNTYLDLPITDNMKFFVGGGMGLAQIREKVGGNVHLTAFNIEDNSTDYHTINDHESSKKKNNFAYSLTAGISAKIAANTNIELAYSWKDFGKTKYKKDEDGDRTGSKHYKGHILTAGIRFDI